MEMLDFYALLDSRDYTRANTFLREYLPGYKELSDGYSYPPYLGDVEFETDDFDKMLSFLSENNGRYYRFYFDPIFEDLNIKKGMLFFNIDDTMIIGVRTSEDVVPIYAEKIKIEFSPISVLVGYGVPPPDNAEEFIALATDVS